MELDFRYNFKRESLIKLFRKDNIYLILLLYTLYYSITLISAYPIFEDEPWYASSAYNFSHGGWVISKLIGAGFPNFIFPVFEGILFKILGFSFFSARLTSFLFGFFSIIILRFILQLLNIKRRTIFLVLLIFLFSPGYFFTFHIARPESAAVFFSLVSILFFIKSIKSGKNETRNISMCSFFSGIAFLSHPYAFPVYLNLGIYYLITYSKQKKVIKVFYFSMIAILVFLVFLANSYLVMRNNFQIILDRTSVSNSFIYNSGSFFVSFLSKRMLSLNGILIVTLGILPGLVLWKKLELRMISFAILMLLIISSFVFSSSYSGNHYLLNYIGLFAMISIAILVGINDKKIILFICLFYIVSYSILNIKKNHGNFSSKNHEISSILNSKIPSGSNIYGDIRFWFMLPKTNYTAIYWNRYNKPLQKTISESDWILVCNEFAYNDITCYNKILQTINEYNIKVDTVLNIPTKQYGTLVVYKVFKRDTI
jgi:hypothetical protein